MHINMYTILQAESAVYEIQRLETTVCARCLMIALVVEATTKEHKCGFLMPASTLYNTERLMKMLHRTLHPAFQIVVDGAKSDTPSQHNICINKGPMNVIPNRETQTDCPLKSD